MIRVTAMRFIVEEIVHEGGYFLQGLWVPLSDGSVRRKLDELLRPRRELRRIQFHKRSIREVVIAEGKHVRAPGFSHPRQHPQPGKQAVQERDTLCPRQARPRGQV